MKTIEKLFIEYAGGGSEAFEKIYEEISPKVFSYLRKRLKNETDVEDVYQRFFLKLHKSKQRYNPSYPVFQWVYVLLRSEMLDYLKSKKRHSNEVAEIIDEKIFLSSMSQNDHLPSLSLLDEVISELEAEHQQLLSYRFEQDLSFSEIGEILGLKESNVRKKLSRIIQKLKLQTGGNESE